MMAEPSIVCLYSNESEAAFLLTIDELEMSFCNLLNNADGTGSGLISNLQRVEYTFFASKAIERWFD